MLPYATLDAFLDHWDGVRTVTLKLLESFEEEDLAYCLLPEWRSVGELFHHIGGQQFFVARGVLTRRWDAAPGEPDLDWEAHRRATTRSIASLSRWLTETQEKLRQWAGEAEPALLTEVRADNPWHEGMRGWLLLHHPYQDELHHRGQLYVIARLLGRDVPQVYAEEHEEWWALQKGR